METILLKVEGMSCNHCVNSIEGSIGKLNGVSNVKVDLGQGTVEVKFDASQVTEKEMKDTIEDQGYDVV
ncbi:copper chaperone CopZ [uncultured Metabacillus sp.]|uniref:copper chaperone CopZ n=1 Tax=Metabacillus sp. Hm71 TaxID=3450743 RepID=UPI002601A949|nr:copper chaperone CopZ [uncultured Metabacillus sp.]